MSFWWCGVHLAHFTPLEYVIFWGLGQLFGKIEGVWPWPVHKDIEPLIVPVQVVRYSPGQRILADRDTCQPFDLVLREIKGIAFSFDKS